MQLVIAPDANGNHNPSFEEIIDLNPEHLHYLDWCEEGEDIETCFLYVPDNVKSFFRKLIKENRFSYHCNALNDDVVQQPYHKIWSGSDLFFAWQTPVKISVNINKLFHCQAYTAKYHRDLFFDAVYKTGLDKVASVAYSQVKYNGMEKYKDYERKEYEWMRKYKKFYKGFENHNPEYVHDNTSNPAPPLEIWEKSAINVVPETFYHRPDITEKTYQCMLFEKPFLMINGQYSHKRLVSNGYKLYDDVFDYAFDSMKNIEDRVDSIVDQLQVLKNKDYNDIYKTLYPTFLYNKKTYIKNVVNEPLPKLFSLDDAVFSPHAEKILKGIKKAKIEAEKWNM